MNDYRCYFLDKNGRFIDVHSFVGADDATAILVARGLLQNSDYLDFELWQGARLVVARKQNAGRSTKESTSDVR